MVSEKQLVEDKDYNATLHETEKCSFLGKAGRSGSLYVSIKLIKPRSPRLRVLTDSLHADFSSPASAGLDESPAVHSAKELIHTIKLNCQ